MNGAFESDEPLFGVCSVRARDNQNNCKRKGEIKG